MVLLEHWRTPTKREGASKRHQAWGQTKKIHKDRCRLEGTEQHPPSHSHELALKAKRGIEQMFSRQCKDCCKQKWMASRVKLLRTE
eukprot:1139990-Pelagomonas_calceolata.AAC.7